MLAMLCRVKQLIAVAALVRAGADVLPWPNRLWWNHFANQPPGFECKMKRLVGAVHTLMQDKVACETCDGS
jgi:hypothetical protein